GELANGRWKIEVLVIHDKTKNASSCAAAKAVERLSLRTDYEGRRFFLMERAERFVISTGALKRKIRADYFDDIVRSCDLFNCLRRNCHCDRTRAKFSP